MFVLSSHSAWCFLLTRYAIVANLKMSTFLDLLSGKEYTFLLIRHPQPLLCLLQSRVSVNVCKMTEEVFPRYKHTEVRDMDQIISFWEEKQRILSILHRHGLSCHQEIRGASALGRLRVAPRLLGTLPSSGPNKGAVGSSPTVMEQDPMGPSWDGAHHLMPSSCFPFVEKL